MLEAALTVVACALGAAIGTSLVIPEQEQPEPVVVVCTWGHGCQETNQTVTP